MPIFAQILKGDKLAYFHSFCEKTGSYPHCQQLSREFSTILVENWSNNVNNFKLIHKNPPNPHLVSRLFLRKFSTVPPVTTSIKMMSPSSTIIKKEAEASWISFDACGPHGALIPL